MIIAATLTHSPQPVEAKRLGCRDYVNLARQVGWPKSQRAKLWYIMERESGQGCNPKAVNPRDPGGSYGLLQINMSNVGWAIRNGWITSKTDLLQPRRNLKVGLELWKLYGWRPWGTKSSISN